MAQSAVKFELYKESDDFEDYFERLENVLCRDWCARGETSGTLANWVEHTNLRNPEEFSHAQGSKRLYNGQDQRSLNEIF